MRVRPSKMLKEFDLLYVEDDPAVREAMTAILSRHFKSFTVAENGQEGIDKFISTPVPIVVTDIKMPIMDGTQMAKYIKEFDPNVHIVITTAYGESDHFINAIEAGVDGFLTKPVDKNKLFDRLNRIAKSLLAQRQQKAMYEKMDLLLNYQKNLVMLVSDGLVEFANQELMRRFSILNIEELNDMAILSHYFTQESQEKILHAMPIDAKSWVEGLKYLKEEDQLLAIKGEEFDDYVQVEIARSEDDNYCIVSFNEITELKNKLSKQEYLATHDALTHLYNRSFILSSLEHLMKKHRHIPQELCVILCDIDHFKQINDTYGHGVGDQVLMAFTQRVQKCLRATDLLGRWGGEEFLILLEQCSIDHMQQIGDKILSAIKSEPFDVIGTMTCSLGITHFKADDTSQSLFDRVDKALYLAKEGGRNRWEYL